MSSALAGSQVGVKVYVDLCSSLLDVRYLRVGHTAICNIFLIAGKQEYSEVSPHSLGKAFFPTSFSISKRSEGAVEV